MSFYAPFTLPFIVGTSLLFLIVVWRYVSWFFALPKADRRLFWRSIPSMATFKSLWEAVRECLLHVRIFKVDWRLGYMHASLAFGWFLLIAVGSLETIAYLGFEMVPLQGHVFFKYFAVQNGITEHKAVWDFVMDFLLAVVLSGVLMAWFKRLRSRSLGMRRTTKHIVGDKVALSFLWFIFPLRLVAESITSALYGGGSFLTGSCGALLDRVFGDTLLAYAYEPAWWCYSIALGGFFVAMPFSRYMHIFTEIPLIFLRNAGLKVASREKSYDNFEVQACSRCGVCIDPCQLQSVLNINDVQSVYFVRDRRYNMLTQQTAQNCLMCGRCADRCPVGIDLLSLRLNSREAMRNIPAERRYDYFKGLDRSEGEGRVGYFAGCMTLLTPRTMTSMAQIFEAVNEQVWWADRDGGVCCGRPLKLSGEVDSARKMMRYNTDLFRKHNIRVLVTSCPICLKVFKEDYNLEGIEVLHHSEYIARLIASGRLALHHTDDTFTYHDPCELGRGGGIYEAPRSVIESVGRLLEADHNRRDALCCGSSLANTVINDASQLRIATAVTEELDKTGAQTIVTACPLCKKALSRSATHRVRDLSEVVARAIVK
ncbi:MAG: (Fe-S)-binding protein [Rikenellaceae bacterium]|nr:(Fe-S)-binding protein [Rikenellaceae bacterium]